MCVIIVKPSGATMPDGYLENCYDNNPDGFGWMYAEDGRVIADKFIPKDFDEVLSVWNCLADIDVIFHLRWLTTGDISKAHCHPFRILKDNEISHDLFFMHNGTFKVDQYEGENDTIAFKNTILKPLLVNNPDLLQSRAFISMLEGMESWSRMAFLSGDGTLTLTREFSWVKSGECNLSNNYSTRKGYRDPAPVIPYYGGMYTPYAPPVKKKEVTSILPFANTPQIDHVFNDTTLTWEPADTELVEVLISLPEHDLLVWMKEDFDDAVETLMENFIPEHLADLLSCMGIAFAAKPQEMDVEYLITEYPETAVEFIKEEGKGWWNSYVT